MPKSSLAKEVLTPADETALSCFETGNEVGDLACELFPNSKWSLSRIHYKLR
jgi:hypothetical protein